MDIPKENKKRFQQSDTTINLLNSLETKFDDMDKIFWHKYFIEWLKNNEQCPKIDLTQICTIHNVLNCNVTSKYRTINGSCNNLQKSFQGAAFTAYSRLLPANYDDGIFRQRKLNNGHDLPNPRVIGSKLIIDASCYTKIGNLSLMPNVGAIIFSQLIIHDVASHVMKQHGESILGIQCCSSDRRSILPAEVLSPACNPIAIPEDDEFYSVFNITCNNFVRSQTIASDDCVLKAGEQVNAVTSYVDASFVYGSNEDLTKMLRSFVNGLLKIEDNMLPIIDGHYVAGKLSIALLISSKFNLLNEKFQFC